MLGDGNNSNAFAPEHGLEGYGVFPLAGEPRELPDQYDLERGRGLAALVDHVAELGPIGDSAALGLVHVFAGHGVAVVLRVVPERPHLGGHREVHVLAVAGDPGVEGRRGRVGWLFHCCFLRFLWCIHSSLDNKRSNDFILHHGIPRGPTGLLGPLANGLILGQSTPV